MKHYTSLFSRGFGAMASTPFPKPVQLLINHGYVRLLGLDMTEFDKPGSYPTLCKLFTRSFLHEKEIDQDANTVISPVDALVTDFGEIKKGRAYQIKGMDYDVGELFGQHHQQATSRVADGQFVNLYLSPKDYHRYHAPRLLQVKSLTHIPGRLYPVNFPLLRNKKNLFIENERVILECEGQNGDCYVMVLVGALNVGKMHITFEPSIQTNSHIRQPVHYQYDDLWLQKGELFGWFEMGSTILLFSQKDVFAPDLSINQKVRFAENIGKVK